MDEKGTFLLSRGVCDVKDLQLGRAGGGGGGGASSHENLYTPRQSNVSLSKRSDLTAGSPHVSGYF